MVEQDNQRLTTRYCFLVRHGERADQASETAEEYRNYPDPYLTQRGHQQAIETGQWLKGELAKIEQSEGRPIDKITLSTSPFERCISTCAKLGEALNIFEVDINYRYCELLAQSMYTENPMPLLHIRTKGFDTLKVEKSWEQFTFVDDHSEVAQAEQLHPESRQSAKERVISNIENQEANLRAQDDGKLEVDIICSHGFHIDQTAQCLDVDWQEWCQYCATTSYKLVKKVDGNIERSVIHVAQSDYV